MTRSRISVLVSGIALAFGITFAVGCSGGSSGPTNDSETTGEVRANDATYGCGNALIRQQQGYCVTECSNSNAGAVVSSGLKYCKTDDPSGMAGNVDAPCACTTPEAPADFAVLCSVTGQSCKASGDCCVGLACLEDGICAAQ